MIALFYGDNMKITLFKVTDSQDTVNKTMSNGFDIEVRLKSDFNILSPDVLLLIEGFDVRNYNYLSIPEFSRFYFVDNITNVNNRMYRLTCSCDVLQTYKDNIAGADAIYNRSIVEGDYHNINGTSQKWEFTNYNSEVELVDGSTIIISTVSTK